MRKIYFDHAATTPIDKHTAKQIYKFQKSKFGNASSVHSFGQQAKAVVENSRRIIAHHLYAQPEEIIFTSGATEANNLALKGITAYQATKQVTQSDFDKIHIITSSFEHPSIMETALRLEKQSQVELTFVAPEKDGHIRQHKVIDAIQDNTVLISVMYVNNELGTVQPIQALGKQLLDINQQRQANGLPRIFYHTDAVQAYNYLNCRPDHLKVDAISFSGHKIYGPKGVGWLYLRQGTHLLRLMDGGSQEHTLRAGTLNSPAIMGVGIAVKKLYSQQDKYIQQMQRLRHRLVTQLKSIPKVSLNTHGEAIPGTINLRVKDKPADELLIELDLQGVAVSAGSACASGSHKTSHVLTAVGMHQQAASESIRISMGRDNTQSDVDYFIKLIKKTVSYV